MYPTSLTDLGWSAHELSQLDLSELTLTPARIAEVHRNRLLALTENGETDLTLPPAIPMSDLAVGDWVLTQDGRVTRRLDRRSSLQRRAAGTAAETQAIAANVDTLFLVTSCNADFSPRRLERYLALAHEAGAEPVILLTKADAADDPADWQRRAERLGALALTLDARAPDVAGKLSDWCKPGRTVALVGSSGVGKTTLTNTLTGTDGTVAPIREDDAKGRHTTTARSLRRMAGGGWIIDTPGMRAIRLLDVAEGIDATFADVADLAGQCRFRDCGHGTEPGCAVQAAVADGRLDPARLDSWQRLKREDRRNSEAVHEAHARYRSFGKLTRTAMRDKRRMQDLDD